jgi:nucleoid-associated protein YejK
MGVFVVNQEYSSRDFDVDPLQKSEVGSIKSILVRDIIEISPTVQSENTQLSADLSEWQNGSQAQGLMTFLRGRGYSGMRLRNLKAPFNE